MAPRKGPAPEEPAEGDAHVVRNAGGRATDDAIRSLVISHKLLGTVEWFVIHHTNCGMELFTDEVMGSLLEDNLATASLTASPGRIRSTAAAHRRAISSNGRRSTQEESVIQDVRRNREHPLVPRGIPVYGYVYDVKTGRLDEVRKATEAGRPG